MLFPEMTENLDIRSYVNPHPHFAAAGQMERLSDGETYVEDKSGKIIDAVIASVRRDRRSIVQVDELFLLAPVIGTPNKRRRSLAERIEAIKAAGGVVRERSSGLQCGQAGFSKAIVRATEMISNSGRGQAGRTKSGRPSRELTKEQKEAVERIWTSRRYQTRTEAIAAIHALGIRVSKTYLYGTFGIPEKPALDPSEVAKIGKQKPFRQRKQYVYFIRNGNTVKIGHSHSPHKRMADMRTANHAKLEMLAITDGGRMREKVLHKKFAKLRLSGEWFTLAPEITKYISGLKRRKTT